MMKKHKLFLSLLLAAALICAPVMFAACTGDEKTQDITWSAEQVSGIVGGSGGPATVSVAIKITFASAVDKLAAGDVTVGGSAAKSGAAFTKSADSKVWTVPVTVSEEGIATVQVNKTGIENKTRNVWVYQSNGEENPLPSQDITWSIEQVGGAADTASTTAIKITFASDVETLAATEVAVAGTAAAKAGTVPGADAGNKKIWTVPVTVTAAGEATVAVNKAGVKSEMKTVAVFYKAPTVPDGEFANANGKDPAYTGTPFYDTTYPATMPKPAPDQENGQKIPGKVMLAFYDVGGQGVAYNEIGAGNQGSGALNGTNGYKNYFRMGANGTHAQGASTPKGPKVVDTSYMKNGWDMGTVSKFETNPLDMLYVGWTDAGEWLNCTVDIETTGVYEVKLLYTAPNANPNLKSAVSIEFDGGKAFKHVPTSTETGAISDQSYHKWGKEVMVEELNLQAGISVMTLRVVDWGSMNLCYVEFTLKT